MLHLSAVDRQETEKLLYEYRRMTSKTLDRSTFRDLLHGTFGMTDDFFMDRGGFQSAIELGIVTGSRFMRIMISCMFTSFQSF